MRHAYAPSGPCAHSRPAGMPMDGTASLHPSFLIFAPSTFAASFPFEVVLKQPAATTNYFADRPNRQAGFIKTSTFVQASSVELI